jgi:hypothetical protein
MGYLEAYGAAEEKHARSIRLIKTSAILLAAVLVVGGLLYAFFVNHSEEQRVKTFIGLLKDHRYPDAYLLWGCSQTQPCPNYKYDKFLEDWGEKSPHADQAGAHIALAQSCGTGVLLVVDYPHAEAAQLWVERDSKTIGYAPWTECPGRHLHVGAWLKSVFGG